MDAYVNSVAIYLFAQSWQTALLAGIVGLVSLALRNRSAHIRYLLWLIVLAKCLVPPIYSVPVAVLPDRLPVEKLPHPVLLEAPADDSVAVKADAPIKVEAILKPHESKPAVPNTREIIVLVWLVGAFLFLLWVGARAVRYTLWLRCRRMPLPPNLRQLLQELFVSLRLKKLPRIWLTREIGQPFVWGLLRGSVYLPVDFTDLDVPQHRRTILAHELSHVARLDAGVNLLQVAAQAIYWFHPFVWWANRKIRQEREKCCDEMAVAQLSMAPEHYTGAIVEALATERRSARPIPTLAIVGSVKDIEERIKTMLRPGKKFYKRPSLVAATAILLVALLTVPTSFVLTARAEAAAKSESQSTKTLHQAAKAGDINQVKALLGQGVDINVKDDEGLTPLHHAIKEGHTELARFLIDQDADLKAKEKRWDYTPLHYAIWFNNTDIVEVLVNKGVDVNYTPKRDYSPLINAIWSKDKYNMAKLLVDHGAKFDVRDQGGWTAFRWAAWEGQHDVIELFVANGADISTFHMAAYRGDLDRVKNFVEQGTDVDTKDELDWTPLFWVVCRGRTEVVRYLIDKGADVKSKTQDQHTVLHPAARAGAKNILQLLIAQGADVRARDRRGRTPLYCARNREVADLLIREGANVNVRDRGAATPLWRAASNGNTEVVEILIANGADVNTNDYQGRTAMMQAKEEGHTGVVELLRQHGAKETLHGAAASGNINEVKRLIAQGSDVNAKIQYDITPLLATRELSIVELLVSKGARIDARNQGGRTLLHLACRNGHKDIAEFLIRKGADVNLRDGGGMTPLWLAAGHREVEIAEILIANGADVTAKDNRGRTPLERATAWWAQCDEMVELLKKHGAKE